MVAGLFAFLPVEQASTVHQSLLDELRGSGNFDNTELSTQIDELDQRITYDITTFEDDLPDDGVFLTLQNEDAYSGDVSILVGNGDESVNCNASFTVDVDTNDDGVSDTTVSTATAAGTFATDFDPLPAGVDQIFINSNGADDFVEACLVSVIVFLSD